MKPVKLHTDHMRNEQGHNAELMIHPPSKNLKGSAVVLKKALPNSQPKELLTKLEKVKNIDKYIDLALIDPAGDPPNW